MMFLVMRSDSDNAMPFIASKTCEVYAIAAGFYERKKDSLKDKSLSFF